MKEYSINTVPPRIKYYLLEWKDKHIETYTRKYGSLRLCDLTLDQIESLFGYAAKRDYEVLLNLNK